MSSHLRLLALVSGCLCGLLVGCSQIAPLAGRVSPPRVAATVPVQVTTAPLAAPPTCLNQFVPHTLPHTTRAHGDAVHLFESNGAGVAINDLNGDGLQDIVLANLDGPATLLWNLGDLNFRKESLPDEDTRAVNIVDVDGDGRLDIVFTHRTASVSLWRNAGPDAAGEYPRFVRETLPTVLAPAYVMAWGDVNGAGSLDLVTGSYDADLSLALGNTFLFSQGAGVYYYARQGDGFVPQRLSAQSQALAVALYDFSGDGRPDIVIGNDFDSPDQTWAHEGDAWVSRVAFSQTAHSTMSLDWGNIDNQGQAALLAADMKPYSLDVNVIARWLPMMASMPHSLPKHDPQVMENVLQIRDSQGRFQNQGVNRGVDASGWSWSAKFGDLDNDGFLDLYVVNGMIAAELFGYLPNNELVEENQAFRNTGQGRFVRAPAWGLGSTASGRGMSMADLDNDGTLDIVVNNLQSPSQLFENRLCGGSSLEVELAWPASRNTRALGAQVELHTSMGTLTRDVRSGSGYLSGDTARLHFGFPDGATLYSLTVRWPDGQTSLIDGLAAHTRLFITR
ncbi:MAG: CRTAC1 family protein [Anaerolineae bacterium]|nr:CRTAC1 family protein [Anaerolineae bacterium]